MLMFNLSLMEMAIIGQTFHAPARAELIVTKIIHSLAEPIILHFALR